MVPSVINPQLTSMLSQLYQKDSICWRTIGVQLLASSSSGMTEICITYPTDYAKVMLQLDERRGQNRLYRNMFDVLGQTIRTHGVFGVYRGFSVVMMGTIPKYVSRFGTYEQIKRMLKDPVTGQLQSRDKFVCGMFAGLSEAIFAVIPQESVKIKFINDRCSGRPQYSGLINGIRQIVQEKGARAIYQGATPTLVKQSFNQAFRFLIFESLKEWHEKKFQTNGPTKVLLPMFGAIAGAFTVLCNTPIDVVKTRMQSLEAQKYGSTINCIAIIYRQEGLLAFYKGLGPRLIKVPLEVAIAFTMYNVYMDFFNSLSV